jgi:hypothetical protein
MSLGIRTNKYRRVSNLTRTEIDGHQLYHRKGDIYYVDASASSSGDGKSWDTAFTTMQAAFDVLVGGETIFFVGKLVEQLVTPVQIFDVTVVGAGNRPRHADSTPSGGNTYASQWAPPASGAVSGQATVRVLQQGWRFENILFTMESSTAAGIELVRNAAAGNSERDASHAIVSGCKFAGAGVGIRFGVAGEFTELVNHAIVEDCEFLQNTYGIRDAIGIASCTIRRNIFRDCTNALIAKAGNTYIYENIVNGFTAAANSGGIDLNGGSGLNVISKNVLGGTYSEAGGYRKANANDVWWGNYTSVTSGTDLASINVADPA